MGGTEVDTGRDIDGGLDEGVAVFEVVVKGEVLGNKSQLRE